MRFNNVPKTEYEFAWLTDDGAIEVGEVGVNCTEFPVGLKFEPVALNVFVDPETGVTELTVGAAVASGGFGIVIQV